jgi:sodium/hydrogen antiporter
MNDVVLLPIVVLSMLFLRTPGEEHATASRLALGLFVLGPGAGVLTGLVGITLLDRVRKKFGVRRDYESLYALGVAFTAFAAAEALGGSGFLAAFAAGMTVAALDVELCDCVLDYGEATAEMFLLLTFVAFGASLIWRGLEVATITTVLFAVLALVVRTAVLFPVLMRAGLDRQSLRIVALFGPRGLSTLLLVLLPVFAGVPNSEQLFTICCLVVLMSVILHGSAIGLIVRRPPGWTAAFSTPVAPAGVLTSTPSAAAVLASPVPPAAPAAIRPPSAVAMTDAALDEGEPAERITIDEMQALERAGEPVVLLDVRTQRTFDTDPQIARGAFRVPPDDAVHIATVHRIPWKATLVAYCA